jgi:hypothetical protein
MVDVLIICNSCVKSRILFVISELWGILHIKQEELQFDIRRAENKVSFFIDTIQHY